MTIHGKPRGNPGVARGWMGIARSCRQSSTATRIGSMGQDRIGHEHAWGVMISAGELAPNLER